MLQVLYAYFCLAYNYSLYRAIALTSDLFMKIINLIDIVIEYFYKTMHERGVFSKWI